MSINEKKELLYRNVWSIQEVLAYFNISRNQWQKVQVKLEDRPPFGSGVYRDDVFKILKTSVREEMETMRIIQGEL